MCDKKKISIDKGAPDELMKCYFEFVEVRHELNVYKFFDQGGTEIIGDLSVGMKFDFALADKMWVLNITAASCEEVRGKWTNPHGDGAEPDQPYQAQAGGNLPADTSTAVATA